MVVSIRSLGLSGIAGYGVVVECALSGGLPAFDVVGLPDAAVRESRERVRSAVKACGLKFPVSRITVNLAPAALKKEGTIYDLPILLGLLAASGSRQLDLAGCAFIGELSLNGRLRPVAGALSMILAAEQAGIRKVFLPMENGGEGSAIPGIEVYPVSSAGEILDHFLNGKPLPTARELRFAPPPAPPERRRPARSSLSGTSGWWSTLPAVSRTRASTLRI